MELHDISYNFIGYLDYFCAVIVVAMLFLGIASAYKVMVLLSLLMNDLPLLGLEECMFSLLMMDLDLPRLMRIILLESLILVMFLT